MIAHDGLASLPGAPATVAKRGTLLIFAWTSVLVATLSSFTADDAFIVYRYAENAAAGNGLVYNATETISALTSPAHALLCTLLALLHIPLVLGNKIIGLAALVVSGALVSRAAGGTDSCRQLIFLLVTGSPLAVLWSMGGLETSLLMVCLTVLVVLPPSRRATPGDCQLAQYSLLAGVCFLLRHDSALFLAPCLVHQIATQVRERRAIVRPTALLCLPGACMAIAWLVFSGFYYHDLLPTSYYTKTPSFNWPWMAFNAVYIFQFALLSGLGLLLVIRWRYSSQGPVASSAAPSGVRCEQRTGICIGLLLTLFYGLGMVTGHMMFAYRFLLPYLPVAVICLVGRDAATPTAAPRSIRVEMVLACCLQLGTLSSLLWVSLNPGVIGEYRHVTVPQYWQFMSALESQAEGIRLHWKDNTVPGRPPIIFVYAAGRVGHQLSDAHIVDGNLLSYRHTFAIRNEPSGVSRSADYVMAIVGHRHGTLDQQLGGRLRGYLRIARTTMQFDGKEEHLDVYFNSKATSLRLPRYIDGSIDSGSSSDRSMQ